MGAENVTERWGARGTSPSGDRLTTCSGPSATSGFGASPSGGKADFSGLARARGEQGALAEGEGRLVAGLRGEIGKTLQEPERLLLRQAFGRRTGDAFGFRGLRVGLGEPEGEPRAVPLSHCRPPWLSPLSDDTALGECRSREAERKPVPAEIPHASPPSPGEHTRGPAVRDATLLRRIRIQIDSVPTNEHPAASFHPGAALPSVELSRARRGRRHVMPVAVAMRPSTPFTGKGRHRRNRAPGQSARGPNHSQEPHAAVAAEHASPSSSE